MHAINARGQQSKMLADYSLEIDSLFCLMEGWVGMVGIGIMICLHCYTRDDAFDF
jgi:hypothetical protein